MQNIVINKTYLGTLLGNYISKVNEIELMLGKIYGYGTLAESYVDVEVPFKIRLGGAEFAESVEAVNRLNEIRAGLVTRLNNARAELRNLEYAVQFLLRDSEAVEQLSTLSAEQFEYFVPKGT